MSAAPTFGEAAAELELRGFDPVPIRPGGKAPAPAEWQVPVPAAARLPRYAACGVGLLTRRTPGADIDVRRQDAAEAVDRLAVARLGDGPPRYGLPPKRLRLCRADAPFPKVATRELVLPGEEPGAPGYKAHKVEVLGDGQQCVCFGLHPDTRRPYAWPDGSPLGLERQDLPPIDAGLAARFVAEAEALLIREFRARPRGSGVRRPPSRPWRPGPPPRPVRDLGEARAVLAALDRLPNDDLDYDTWIAVAYALKAALGDAGEPVFLAWSTGSAKDDPDATVRAWASAEPDRCGWRYLERLAGTGR